MENEKFGGANISLSALNGAWRGYHRAVGNSKPMIRLAASRPVELKYGGGGRLASKVGQERSFSALSGYNEPLLLNKAIQEALGYYSYEGEPEPHGIRHHGLENLP
jgi:hypothetical protein